jgi:hypothetical protein
MLFLTTDNWFRCHPERSEAESRDLLFFRPHHKLSGGVSHAASFEL